jgi:NADH-quinone oxidoreductase subunit C
MTDQIVPAGATELEVIEVRDGAFGVQGTGDTSGFGGLTRPVAMPAAATQPFGGWYDEVHDRLLELVGGGLSAEGGGAGTIEKVVIDRGEITFFIKREALRAVVKHLRDDDKLRFEFCSSVSGVHYPHETGRELHVVYNLLSMSYRRRLRLEVTTSDDDRHIPSVVPIYPTADWHERETWDFFGVIFDGHPALTRILMPDDWIGHPQRKDYPLGGIPVEYKGGTTPPPDQRRSYS